MKAASSTRVSITNVALTSNVVTVTTAVAHGLGVNQIVTVAATITPVLPNTEVTGYEIFLVKAIVPLDAGNVK